MNTGKKHNDYIFRDGKFIGSFEEMYRDIGDPWGHGDARDIYYDMALYLLLRHDVCARGGTVLDIGCGKGAFTARLRETLHEDTRITAVDIAPTAIEKAVRMYGSPGIEFRTCDISREHRNLGIAQGSLDLVVMSDIMWYILPAFQDICCALKEYMKAEGFLLVNQTFYKPGVQTYGNEIVSTSEEMLKLFGMKVADMVETNRFESHHGVVLFNQGGGTKVET